jgi:DNA primase
MKADRLLDEIKSKVDIIEFISDYVTLKKSGQNYKGLCPFHSEKTPSFMVSQSKQIFHCFGCGTGGDVISFLMKHDNLTFGEATRYIAKKAGIDLKNFEFDKNNISEKREKLIQANEEAIKFYIKNLNNSETPKTYLKKRGINEESILNFRIGYANDEKDNLFRHMKKMGYSDSLLKDAGLIISDGKEYRDLFRKRIIFPIYNLKNDLIAFGGRVMDDSLPKYINSPETDVFKKSESLFAINLSKEDIRKTGYAIIVEGYLDSIICHQYGFKNTVAPLGTALTPMHLYKLKLLTKKVILVFDADEAGIAAARRSLVTLAEFDFRAKVLLLPKDEDPDSFLRKNGSKPFKKMLAEAMSMVDFLLRTSKGDKIDNVREMLGIIAVIKDLIIADEMLNELCDRSRINETALREELEKIRKKSKSNKHITEIKQTKTSSNREERILLSALISFPEKADYVLSRLDIEDVKDKTISSILGKIKSIKDNFNIRTLLEKAEEEEMAIITELSFNPGFDLEHVDKNINDCLHILRQRRFEEKRKIAEESGDISLLDSLLKEKRRLIKKEQS